MVIFYKDFFGDLLPTNYEVKAYEQRDADIGGFSFFDYTGNGDWQLVILVKYDGAI